MACRIHFHRLIINNIGKNLKRIIAKSANRLRQIRIIKASTFRESSLFRGVIRLDQMSNLYQIIKWNRLILTQNCQNWRMPHHIIQLKCNRYLKTEYQSSCAVGMNNQNLEMKIASLDSHHLIRMISIHLKGRQSFRTHRFYPCSRHQNCRKRQNLAILLICKMDL